MDQRLPTSSDRHSGGDAVVPAGTPVSEALPAPVLPPRPSPTFPSLSLALPALMHPQYPSSSNPSSSRELNSQDPVQSVVQFHQMYIRSPVGDDVGICPSSSLIVSPSPIGVSRTRNPSDPQQQQQEPSPLNASLPKTRSIRYHQSVNPDGSWSAKTEEELVPMALPLLKRRRLMPPAELADLAIVDPGHAKRIIESKQAAARAEQKRMRDALENEELRFEMQHLVLQNKVQGQQLQALSAQNQELQTQYQLQRQSIQQQQQMHIYLTQRWYEERRQLQQQLQQLQGQRQEQVRQQDITIHQLLHLIQLQEDQLQQVAAGGQPEAVASPTETNLTSIADMGDSSSSEDENR